MKYKIIIDGEEFSFLIIGYGCYSLSTVNKRRATCAQCKEIINTGEGCKEKFKGYRGAFIHIECLKKVIIGADSKGFRKNYMENLVACVFDSATYTSKQVVDGLLKQESAAGEGLPTGAASSINRDDTPQSITEEKYIVLVENRLTAYEAWKLKKIEALLFDKLGDETQNNICDSEYERARCNWITAHNAVMFFKEKYPEIMNTQHI